MEISAKFKNLSFFLLFHFAKRSLLFTAQKIISVLNFFVNQTEINLDTDTHTLISVDSTLERFFCEKLL